MSAARAVLLALIAATVVARRSSAQVPDTIHLTLDQSIRRALDAGEEMRLARAQVQDADGQVREALSGALPQVTGSVVYTRQFASIFQNAATDTSTNAIAKLFKNSPFGAANTWNGSLTASQILFAGGKVGAGLTGARAFRRAASKQQDETAAEIVYQVKAAYLNAAFAERVLGAAEANLAQAREQLHQVQLYQLAGTRAEYDLLRARVDAANQEPAVVGARSGYALAVLELKRLVNVSPDAPLVLDTPLDAADGTVPVPADTAVGEPDRPALAAAEATVAVQEQAVKVALSDRWPQLSVASTFSEQAFPAQVSPIGARYLRSWNAEVRLSFPIFLGFKTTGSVERARASLETARAHRDQAREQAALDVAQAKADVQRNFALLSARRQTVVEADRALHLASVRYGNGLSTQLEVSDARVLREQADVNAAQATRDYLLSLAQLERALGRPVAVVRRPIDGAAPASHSEGNEQ